MVALPAHTPIAPGISLWDVSSQMPERRRPQTRGAARRLYVHHSGRLGAPGVEGAYNSARYVVEHKRFPGPAYHYWLPYADARDVFGNRVVYQLESERVRAWHTGGAANGHGLGVALQGNTNRRPMSDNQIELLEALLPWLRQRHAATLASDWLSWHSEAGHYGGREKRACPGRHAVEWLRAYREAT